MQVRVESVSKVFRQGRSEVRALDGVSLAVEEREFVVVVGASGCGKSTLLNLLAGLLAPTEGTVEHAPELERRGGIGMVFQTPVLLPWRNTFETDSTRTCTWLWLRSIAGARPAPDHAGERATGCPAPYGCAYTGVPSEAQSHKNRASSATSPAQPWLDGMPKVSRAFQ